MKITQTQQQKPVEDEKQTHGKTDTDKKRDVDSESKEFSSLLTGKKKGKGEGDSEAKSLLQDDKDLLKKSKEKDSDLAQAASLGTQKYSMGSSILDSMTASKSAEAPHETSKLSQIASEMADKARITVSDPSFKGKEEVRISFKDLPQLADVGLKDVELRLSQSGGNVHVDFVTPNADHQAQSLMKSLENHLQDTIPNVSVQMHTTGDGGSQDGRSRNQYIAEQQED